MRLRRRHIRGGARRTRRRPRRRRDVPRPDRLRRDRPARRALAGVRRRAAPAPGSAPRCRLVRDAADAGVALLGVCFGGQLLAQAFGGSVARSTTPEIGWYDVDTRRPEIWCPAGRGSSGISTGGRCRPAPPRSPGPRTRRRRSCSAARWRCSSTPRSITHLLDLWLADDRDGEVVGAGLSHDELRAAHNRTRRRRRDNASAAWCAAS